MFRSLVLAAFVLFLSVMAVMPAAAGHRTVRVGVYENPPLVFADRTGGYDGFAIDILRQVARREGWRLEFVPGTWKECLARLSAGEIDLQVAIAWSEERARRYDFNRETLFNNWGRIYVSAGSAIESLLDLAGKRIAVLDGDIHARILGKTLEAFQIRATMVPCRDYATVLKKVADGDVHGGLTNRLFGLQNARRFRVLPSAIILNPIEIRYAASRNLSRDLLAAIDRWLGEHKKMEGGYYHQAIDRWLGIESPARIPAWVPWLLAVLALAVGMGFVFIVALRRMVRRRTVELEEEKEKLAAERARSEAIIAGLGHGISIQDRDFRVTYQNDVHKRLVGHHEGEFCYQAYEGNDHVCDGCPLVMAFADGGVHRAERHVKTPERELWVEITASPLLGPDGAVIAGLEIVQDISERRLAEEKERQMAEQLRHSQKMEAIGRLAGGVAHDFNNLLTSILGYCELALAEIPPDHRLAENLKVIRSAGNKAASLTRQLLAYSRRQVMAFVPLDVNRVVKSMLDIMRRTLGEDIGIRTSLAPDLPLIEGDQSQIEQVIMNLAVNSRDAMERGGEILIETGVREFDEAYMERHPAARPGRYVMLAVSDTGCGMSPDIQERIFDPFYTTKEQGRGTGLGLATVYGIVKQHRGYIWVYSEVGRGTTFRVYVPVSGGVEKGEPEAGGFKGVPGGSETILVVDDQEDVRRLVADVLAALGYHALTAAGGEDALRAIADNRVDLVVSDVIMPGMTGPMLAERIKEISPETRVVFMSGYTDNHIVLRELRKESLPLIQKPVSPKVLAVMVRSVLDEKEA